MRKICRSCSNRKNFRIFVAKDYFLGSKKKYEYALCSYCNSLSLQQVPINLTDLYKDYYSFNQNLKISFFKKKLYDLILKKL